VKQRVKKTPQESYFDNNTALLVENEFANMIKDEIFKEIEKV